MINECISNGIYELYIAVPGKIKKENKKYYYDYKVNEEAYYTFTQYKLFVKYDGNKKYVRELLTNKKIPILDINITKKGVFDVLSGISYVRDNESYKEVKVNDKYKYFVVLRNDCKIISEYYINEDEPSKIRKAKKALVTKDKTGNLVDAINIEELSNNDYDDKLKFYNKKRVNKIFDILEENNHRLLFKYVDGDKFLSKRKVRVK